MEMVISYDKSLAKYPAKKMPSLVTQVGKIGEELSLFFRKVRSCRHSRARRGKLL